MPDLLSNYDTVYTQSLNNLSILIVNDGSKDHTVDSIKRFKGKINITLIDNAVNGGLGKVIRQGLKIACETLKDDDIIITMDGDNSHLPQLIPKMVQVFNLVRISS